MPTKKELFLKLMDVLKTNIVDVDNRVYSAYPKQEPVLPFIVISNPEYSEESYGISGVFSYAYSVEIYVYTNTSQQLDELTQQIIDVLKNSDFYNGLLSIKDNGGVEYKGTNKIMHEGLITVDFQY